MTGNKRKEQCGMQSHKINVSEVEGVLKLAPTKIFRPTIYRPTSNIRRKLKVECVVASGYRYLVARRYQDIDIWSHDAIC